MYGKGLLPRRWSAPWTAAASGARQAGSTPADPERARGGAEARDPASKFAYVYTGRHDDGKRLEKRTAEGAGVMADSTLYWNEYARHEGWQPGWEQQNDDRRRNRTNYRENRPRRPWVILGHCQ